MRQTVLLPRTTRLWGVTRSKNWKKRTRRRRWKMWRMSARGMVAERSLVSKVTRERLREERRICRGTWRREENYAALRKVATGGK